MTRIHIRDAVIPKTFENPQIGDRIRLHIAGEIVGVEADTLDTTRFNEEPGSSFVIGQVTISIQPTGMDVLDDAT